ncbi:uncharacterized protein [Littorina saxatilis]|uniref:uncharacterized protein n=1 Tax=Littorina saxatilis TaxID=31220 RepID=UPI0038B4A134
MDLYSVTALYVWGLVLMLLGRTEGLNCWHCIADNCEQSPEDNYKASEKTCQPGQQCQKVFFQMQSDVTTTLYSSVVRSCAEQCVEQDDFFNCTDWQFTTRGCVRRNCCGDEDLCNASQPVHFIASRSLYAGVLGAALALSWTVVSLLLS